MSRAQVHAHTCTRCQATVRVTLAPRGRGPGWRFAGRDDQARLLAFARAHEGHPQRIGVTAATTPTEAPPA